MLEEAGHVGGFRSIIQYVPAKSLRAAKHGDEGGEDTLGHWNSQAGQDRTIALLTDYKPGFFIDLAANEPILHSNTRALERDYGWRGICIDGNQKNAGEVSSGSYLHGGQRYCYFQERRQG